MYLKIHQTRNGKIIAVCDANLIGKVYTEGKKVINLDKYRSFYVGKKTTKEEIQKELEYGFNSVNFVGTKSIQILLDLELVSKEDILHISEVPYTQIYNL